MLGHGLCILPIPPGQMLSKYIARGRGAEISHAFAYTFAASPSKRLHAERPWAQAGLGRGRKPLWKHFAAEAAKTLANDSRCT